MPKSKDILIDGATGEGGGQLIRMATSLSAVTLQPIRIVNIRANRPRGGGLKSQHLTAAQWLADVSGATCAGLEIGSQTLTFRPQSGPAALARRHFAVRADSGAASALLILQAMLPYLVFAGGVVPAKDSQGQDAQQVVEEELPPEPIEVEISGGTNVSFSPSYEYLDQVLLPALLDRFGISVERRLLRRGWSLGPQSRGAIWVRVHPLRPGQSIKVRTSPKRRSLATTRTISAVDASIVAPQRLLDDLKVAIAADMATAFPRAETRFVTVEDSGHDSRIYILMVARSDDDGLCWARDALLSTPRDKDNKKKPAEPAEVAARVSRGVCRALREEVSAGGEVDEHLQDQLICFQALAEGVSVVRGREEGEGVNDLTDKLQTLDVGERPDRADKPFGSGSLHTQTARWIASELLPAVRFYNGGSVCEGAGHASS